LLRNTAALELQQYKLWYTHNILNDVFEVIRVKVIFNDQSQGEHHESSTIVYDE